MRREITPVKIFFIVLVLFGEIIAQAEQPATQELSSEQVRSIVKEEISKLDQASEEEDEDGPFALHWSGYGDMRFAYYDYPESITQPEGSRGESRAGFDITRFVLELEGEHKDSGIEFEAEVEFEHGGTGSAVELEFDEFGEFEQEVEKGGEVILEELFLKKEFDNGLSVRAGRFYLAIGLLSPYHLPTDYLASGRSEAETTVIPAVWDEIGFEVQQKVDFGQGTLQLVNGLDSTGFSASRWVAEGHQDRFEVNRAEDFAFVGRFDYTKVPGFLLGASGYYGNTSDNRPKDDVDVDGTVSIFDIHTRLDLENLRFQAMVLHGSLDDAQAISERNARLPNSLEVERTPVGDEALAAWGEVGYNISYLLGISEKHRVEPFVRIDYYDTYYDTREELIDNKRYEREVYTGGLSYTYGRFLVAKLDYTHRKFGQEGIDSQNMVRLGLGFVY